MLGLRFGPFQNLGVFVGDDQQPRAAGLFDLRPFRGVDEPFDRAIDDHVDQLQRLDHRAVAAAMAQEVPVDFTGTGAVCGGVGIWIMQKSAPRS